MAEDLLGALSECFLATYSVGGTSSSRVPKPSSEPAGQSSSPLLSGRNVVPLNARTPAEVKAYHNRQRTPVRLTCCGFAVLFGLIAYAVKLAMS